MGCRLFLSERFHYTFGPHEPTLRIESGEKIEVVCPDADNRLGDGSTLSAQQRQQFQGTTLFEGNPMAGPIYVKEVCVGESLAIDILSIDLDEQPAITMLAPCHGLLSADELLQNCDSPSTPVPNHLYQWQIMKDANLAKMKNPLGGVAFSVPLRPMIGAIGVCPPWGQHLSTLIAGDFGGNIDLPILQSETTLLLPVFHEGALLFLGDIHAAQGHGEIVGGGIEASGRLRIRVRRIAKTSIPAPRIITRDHLFAVATDGDLRRAVQLAYARLLDWIADSPQVNRWDVYQLISQAGIVEIGGIVIRSSFTVAAGIPRSLLSSCLNKELEKWQESAGQ